MYEISCVQWAVTSEPHDSGSLNGGVYKGGPKSAKHGYYYYHLIVAMDHESS